MTFTENHRTAFLAVPWVDASEELSERETASQVVLERTVDNTLERSPLNYRSPIVKRGEVTPRSPSGSSGICAQMRSLNLCLTYCDCSFYAPPMKTAQSSQGLLQSDIGVVVFVDSRLIRFVRALGQALYGGLAPF